MAQDILINLDQQRLQQIILILVSNAIKFTPAGGNIGVACRLINGVDDLSVKNTELQKTVNSRPGKQFLEVSVKDTGIGIKEKDLPKLFKLFGFLDTTKEINAKGIGLGLHIAKKISQMFNGCIICQS